MCGIAGILSLYRDGSADHEPLDRMIEAMRLRGPDDSGKAVTDRVAFGMRRLSIIDLEHGHQPIESEDGSVRVIMNGELYSFPEVKKELEGAGHRFRTESDTEILVHGYEEWGIEGLLERLNGMFAFALHDQRNDLVFIARDRMGIKPLLYSVRDGQLCFASSIKALLMTGRIPIDPDPVGIRLYLYNQYIPAPYTVLAGVSKLPPASYIRVDRGTPGEPVRYWRAPDSEKQGADRDWHGELRDLFEDAVRCHMISDVEVGVFLSGGLDSSLVLSYMSEMSPHRVKAFSIAVKQDNVYDESPYARLAAERYGAELIEIPFTPTDAVDAATRYIDHLDEPIADAAQLPTFILSEIAHRHVKVVLSGEGADELFAGYDYYDRFATFSGRFRSSLEPIRRRMAEAARGVSTVERIMKHTYRSTESAYPHVLPGAVCDLLVKDLPIGSTTAELQEEVERSWVAGSGEKGLNRALLADSSGWLPDNLLMKVDRMTMAHSLEARVPFLDYRLVELAARMPAVLKRRNRIGKVIIREAFADRLGETLAGRGKHGFSLPIGHWLQGLMRPLAEETLSAGLKVMPWINRPVVDEITGDLMGGRMDMWRQVWLLLTLAAWFARAEDPGAQP